jgi:O-glycosyl hydrolase
MSMRTFRRLLLLAPALSVGLAGLPALQPSVQATPPARSGSPVQVWHTDVDSETWVERQSDVSFQTKQTTNPLTIKVDDSVEYQEITGFGAALTDSSAWLINELPTNVAP